MYNISVIGAGYVGLSNAVLFAQKNNVILFDIDNEKVNKINNKISPIKDKEIEEYLRSEILNLKASNYLQPSISNADFIIIAIPTNYDPIIDNFDTSILDKLIQDIIKYNSKALIIIKSTLPLGYIDSIKERLKINNITFSPEFLREGKALYDNLYPSRIIIGDKSNKSQVFIDLQKKVILKKDIPVLFVSNKEAESIKLFSNTFLAMRIAFFNELDTFALSHNLNTKNIIEGVSLDPRIGDYYNNPSFGFGGYCLPKDVKQLVNNYKDIPEKLITAIHESNQLRKDLIIDTIVEILSIKSNVIGVYKLSMKKNSDNLRESAILYILEKLVLSHKKIIIFEPLLEVNSFMGCEVIKSLEIFKQQADLIIANRIDEYILDSIEKVYSRDIFYRD